MAVDSQDRLYAGGNFNNGSGRYVAKYEANSWQALSGGFNDDIWSLAVDAQGKIYAGGSFNNGTNQYVAEYDGTWTNIGTGPALSPFNGTIYSLKVGQRLTISLTP